MKRRTDTKRQASTMANSASAVAGPTLPAWKAFVVQFSRETGATTFSGRIEHLSSGRRAQFGSAEELVAALQRLLQDVAPPVE